MKNKIAILGAGTAGIQAVCHLIYYLKDYEITLVHNPEIKSLGIGESTNPTFIKALEIGLDCPIFDILKNNKLDATLKIGTFYKKWRKNNFVNPLISGAIAIHFNTFKLYDFAISRLNKIWKNKFKQIFGNIDSMINEKDYVEINVNNKKYIFDYVMDCRGFPKSFEGYNIINNPTNHCLVYNEEKNYINSDSVENISTGHIATKDGWMFTIPLTTRKSYGYLFNDKITSVKDAKKNFKKELNILNKNFELKEFIFKSYYSNFLIENRVIKNGNSAVFFEPMFANSLWLYDYINRLSFDRIIHNEEISVTNNKFIKTAKEVEDMICYMYHGGSLYNTNFWKKTKKYTVNKLKNSLALDMTKKILNINVIENETYRWVFNKWSLNRINKNFNYKYW
jgi:hypothetical protein